VIHARDWKAIFGTFRNAVLASSPCEPSDDRPVLTIQKVVKNSQFMSPQAPGAPKRSLQEPLTSRSISSQRRHHPFKVRLVFRVQSFPRDGFDVGFALDEHKELSQPDPFRQDQCSRSGYSFDKQTSVFGMGHCSNRSFCPRFHRNKKSGI
jgi:hypothetical protein